MAKKKKRKQSQKQIKRQLRRVKERKRRTLSSKFWQESSKRADDDVVDDMLPLFRASGGLEDMPGSGLKELMSTLLASADMANEPEFEGIVVDPMLCAETFANVCEEMGIDPEKLAGVSGVEREDAQMEMMEESIRRLLTEELCQDILKGLDALRVRLKGAGKRGEAAKAAGLQSFLSQGNRDVWPMIGLVQAIFHKNLLVGMELLEVAMHVDVPESPQGRAVLLERLNPELLQKTEGLLKKIPGLRGYLEKQADKIWEEGVTALSSGELYLGLFSSEELKGVMEIVAEFVGFDSATGKAETPTLLVDSEDARKKFFARLDEYITDLLTPERVDQLRGELDSILQEMDRDEKWLSFTLMLKEYMGHEDAAVIEKGILLRALLGEMKTAADASGEEGE